MALTTNEMTSLASKGEKRTHRNDYYYHATVDRKIAPEDELCVLSKKEAY